MAANDDSKTEIIMNGIMWCIGMMSVAAVFITMFWVMGGGGSCTC